MEPAMRRASLLLLLLLLSVSVPGWGQIRFGNFPSQIISQATAPTTCSLGDVWINTTEPDPDNWVSATAVSCPPNPVVWKTGGTGSGSSSFPQGLYADRPTAPTAF